MTYVEANPELMVENFRVPVPTFSGEVTRVAPDRACAEGVLDCRMFQQAEQAATDKLHRFLTHLAQGITAYHQMVRTAAQTYADAADHSKELINSVKTQVTTASTYDPRSNLPEYAPGFDRPAQPPQAP